MKHYLRQIMNVFISGAALLAAGCGGSDPKAATEKNFEIALNAHFKKFRECLTVGGRPDEGGFVKKFTAVQVDRGGTQVDFFKGLVRLGLMETAETTTETRNWGKVITQDYISYRFTDKANPFLRPAELDTGFFATGFKELCFGTPEVIEVTNFTEPADALGVKLSTVKYTYKYVDVAPWANEPVFTSRFKWLPEKISATSLEGSEDLILTNSGWMHHKEYQE